MKMTTNRLSHITYKWTLLYVAGVVTLLLALTLAGLL